MLKNDVTTRLSPQLEVAEDQRLGELVGDDDDQRQAEPGPDARASDATHARASGDCCGLRRRRTGCWCSGRRSSGARRRADVVAPVPAALALRCALDGVDLDRQLIACRQLRRRGDEHELAGRRRATPAAHGRRPAPCSASVGLQRRAHLAGGAQRLDLLVRPRRGSRGCAPTWPAARASGCVERPVGLGEDRRLPPPRARFQASSAVKLRNGAIQRSIACVMCHSAVCAERRASDFGAVV